MNARIKNRNLRFRLTLARYAINPEKRISKMSGQADYAKRAREFGFYVIHHRNHLYR
jgi:hypothetical protein